MEISDFARVLLREHAKEPNRLFYAVDLLGSFFRDTQLRRLDAAYEELLAAGLMARTGTIVTFFGEPKSVYRITESGIQEASRELVA